MSDDIARALERLTERVEELSRRIGDEPKPRHAADPAHMTPQDIYDVRFTTTRLLPGYHTPEVDAFLERVALALETIIRERDEARAQLAALQGR
ncbi:DivIVA domain-containing protein [Thermomonospora cellulosilytica]|uniref:Cell wall synthesis protein Wag31 n=1 Tax=Thermomonospora cellulosilytica TaxID=1411118 RepID=A0A7W3R6K1_9ACTN|nr:DivIVA domain-containing protein [Thermomonospora cellulosilytica]MBA9002263.1 DivIVA domain-containing protein [Thermomonospora cellulosilytica]